MSFLRVQLLAIDETVVENTNVKRSIRENVSSAANKYTTVMRNALHHPQSILTKPNCLIFGVYASTFIAYNCTKRFTNDDMTIVTAATATNVSMGIIKDKMFVDMYGKETITKAIPKTFACRLIGLGGIGMFVLRDFFVLGSSLIVPKKVAQVYQDRHAATTLIDSSNDVSNDVSNDSTHKTDVPLTLPVVETVTQFVAPLVIQFVAAPLHILGITLVNKPNEWFLSWGVVRSCFVNTFIAKTIRIVPTFILGTMGNKYIMNILEPHVAPPVAPPVAQHEAQP